MSKCSLYLTSLGLGVLSSSIGCTEWYDLSGAVVVQDEAGQVVNAERVTFCLLFSAGNPKTEEVETDVRDCTEIDIVDGVALLPNAEGEYKGTPMELSVVLRHEDEVYPAELLDGDEDVWCDNVDVDYDAQGNTTTTQFCTYNFEYYYVWSLILPTGLL